MVSFHDKLKKILEKDNRFLSSEGDLLKSEIINTAYRTDEKLISSLLKNKDAKGKFFKNIDGNWVFDTFTFLEYIQDKEFLSNSYTKFSSKIGLNIDGKFLNARGEVSLVWPFKDCVLEAGMDSEESRRKEVFFNEILAEDEINQLYERKVLTNGIKYDGNGKKAFSTFKRDETTGTIKDNLIIKGNNLLVLHSIYKEFASKVKLIYIDPPYNTENDSFAYNDKFSRSTWLTFMKNRFEIAKELLTNDGVIFVQCDDNQQAYLKVLMDEVFSEENFISSITIQTASKNGFKTKGNKPVRIKETILIYSKSKESYKYKRTYTKQEGFWDSHFSRYYDEKEDKIYSLKEKLIEAGILGEKGNSENLPERLKDLSISDKKFKKFYTENKNKIFQTGHYDESPEKKKSLTSRDKIYKHTNDIWLLNGRMLSFLEKSMKNIDGEDCLALALSDIWDDIDFNNVQNEAGFNLKNGKKPEKLLERIIEISTDKGDIVLDYHLGTGTTAAVAHKKERQYIGIEQMPYIDSAVHERLPEVIAGEDGGASKMLKWNGGGEFIYFELKKYNENFIDSIRNAKSSTSLLKIWKSMKEKSFLKYDIDFRDEDSALKDLKNLSIEQQKESLISLLDKNHLYVNYSSIHDSDFACSKEEIKLTKNFYNEK